MISTSDFPIFKNNPHIIYLDSASTMQKPTAVIDAVSEFVSHDYANIHRWVYSLAEHSETAYENSKDLVAKRLGTRSSQVIYTSNTTMWSNLIAQVLVYNWLLTSGSKILMPISEHHGMIVPRQIIAQQYQCEIIYCPLNDDYGIDSNEWSRLYTSDVSIVVCGHISNVTGAILDIASIKNMIRSDTIMIVDASQSAQHIPLDFDQWWYDVAICTGHKMMGYTGIWVVLIHPKRNKLTPVWWGGGIIEDVTTTSHRFVLDNSKREPWTPDIIWAVSLGAAISYMISNGWYKSLIYHEKELIDYCLEQFRFREDHIRLIGPLNPQKRVGIFSFIVKEYPQHARWADWFAQHHICVRAWGHCTHPLRQSLHLNGGIRMSLGPYNTLSDCKRFFEVLDAGILFKNS